MALAAESGAPRFDIARFDVQGNTLLKADVVSALLEPFTGKQWDFRDVQLALEALQDAYREAGYGTVLVILPEQEVDRGAVVLKIAEAKVRKVTVEGKPAFRPR
ncbi:MAG: POTRA domain-containing protein [Sulfuricellaceae bacterium]